MIYRYNRDLYAGVDLFLLRCGMRYAVINTYALLFYVVRLFPLRFDFELQICVFRSQKRMTLLMQSKYAKSDRIFFDLRIR